MADSLFRHDNRYCFSFSAQSIIIRVKRVLRWFPEVTLIFRKISSTELTFFTLSWSKLLTRFIISYHALENKIEGYDYMNTINQIEKKIRMHYSIQLFIKDFLKLI